MKKALSIILALALSVCLCAPAFASGEASGEASAVEAVITVTDGVATLNEDYLAEHDIELSYDTLDDSGVDGLVVETGDMLVSAVAVSGEDSVFTISNADIHLGVNEETAYVASSTTAGSGALVSSGILYITDSTITVDGGANGAEGGHYAVEAYSTGTLVVNNSSMIQTGRAGADGLTDQSNEPGSNNGLLIAGYARSSMSIGASQTYYYNSYVETEGWAAMSTDSASGSGLDFYSYNSEAYAVSGGYGIYADSSCRDWLYATTLRGAEHGVIISNNGAVHVYSGASATVDDALAYYPEDGELTDAGSLIEAGRNCFYIHSPGTGSAFGQQAVVEVMDSTLRTSEALNDQQTLVDYAEKYSQGVADYLDFIRGSIILVKSHSADIDLTNVEIDSYSNTILMTALNADSSSRYLYTEREDTATSLTMTDMDVTGDVKNYDYQRSVEILLDNTSWTGASLVWDAEDWNAYWAYADGMDSVYWCSLDAETYNVEHHGTALTLTNGSVWTVSADSRLDSLTISADSQVVYGEATVDGIAVALEAGKTYEGDILITAAGGASGEAAGTGTASVEEAFIEYIHEWLIAENEINSTMTEDVMENEFMPLVREMDFATFPADMIYGGMLEQGVPMTFEEFAAQYGGEEAAAGGGTSEEAYHAYLKEYVGACPAVTDEQYLEFEALIDASDYTTMPADMMFDATWWGYAAMTYDEFVAAGGVYEIPAFDPNLTAD